MIVEVESNENCETSVFARFKEIAHARLVLQVRLYDRNPAGNGTGSPSGGMINRCVLAQLTPDWSKTLARA